MRRAGAYGDARSTRRRVKPGHAASAARSNRTWSREAADLQVPLVKGTLSWCGCAGLVSQTHPEDVLMSKGSGVSRSDRRRKARREHLRGCCRVTGRCWASTWGMRKQALALVDHDMRVRWRRSPQCAAHQLGGTIAEAAEAAAPAAGQVSGHGRADIRRQWQPLAAPALAGDGDLPGPPVDVVQAQDRDLADPQASGTSSAPKERTVSASGYSTPGGTGTRMPPGLVTSRLRPASPAGP